MQISKNFEQTKIHTQLNSYDRLTSIRAFALYGILISVACNATGQVFFKTARLVHEGKPALSRGGSF